MTSQAANAVAPRWIDRLGSADVYTWPTPKSLRIGYGHLGTFGIRP